MADLAHDANKKTTSGNDGLAFQGLISECIQAAVFGLHAARHGFPKQVFANCRAIYEALDLLELFRSDSSARDLWLSGDSTRIQRELKPAQVRQKLGRKGRDVPYSFLSEFGSHSSVHSVLMRAEPAAGGTEERPRVIIRIGGTYDPNLLLQAYMGLAFQVHHLLLEAIAWSQHFKAGFDENWARLRRTAEAHAAFMNEYIVPWMQERGAPKDAIKSLSGMFDLDPES